MLHAISARQHCHNEYTLPNQTFYRQKCAGRRQHDKRKAMKATWPSTLKCSHCSADDYRFHSQSDMPVDRAMHCSLIAMRAPPINNLTTLGHVRSHHHEATPTWDIATFGDWDLSGNLRIARQTVAYLAPPASLVPRNKQQQGD